MARHSLIEASVTVMLDRRSDVPLHRQLYDGVRKNILEGRLSAGVKLPSTRALSSELGISRNTVMNAFLQLLAEGYLEGQVGSGTYVSRSLPDDLLHAQSAAGTGHIRESEGDGLSGRGTALAAMRVNTSMDRGASRAFRPCIPALDAFPFEIWERLARRRWRRRSTELLDYGHPAGYRPLREAIADYLGASRAVRCSWEQVIVVSGSQQGLDLAAKLLLDPGDAAWVEDPGYAGARAALAGAGARLAPVPVDSEGLDVAAGERVEPAARLACITPSHQ
ncbi:MAG: PLP-dependent aminotransferase family protein [Actinomycetota bacterium]|nr:PLP-dependent aminotransferase family protein [Actinomycetota bacterium]